MGGLHGSAAEYSNTVRTKCEGGEVERLTLVLTSFTVSFSATWTVRSGMPSVKRMVRSLEGGASNSACSGSVARCLPLAFSLSEGGILDAGIVIEG